MARFRGWGLVAMAGCNTTILFYFLDNLKEGRENLWDKDNCLAIEKNPQQQFFKSFEMMYSFIMSVKS